MSTREFVGSSLSPPSPPSSSRLSPHTLHEVWQEEEGEINKSIFWKVIPKRFHKTNKSASNDNDTIKIHNISRSPSYNNSNSSLRGSSRSIISKESERSLSLLPPNMYSSSSVERFALGMNSNNTSMLGLEEHRNSIFIIKKFKFYHHYCATSLLL